LEEVALHIRLRARAGVLACSGLAAAALLAPAAHAAGVAGGTTTITLDKKASGALKRAHVKLRARKPAKLHGRKLTLPVSGGTFNIATGSGSVVHKGSLRISSGTRRVTLSSFTVANSKVSAKVGKKRLTVAKVSGGKTSVAPGGVAATLRGARLKLSAAGAKALDKALKTTAFQGGMRFGTVTASVDRKLTITSGTTTLAPDPNTSKTLAANGVVLGVVPPSQMTASGITFPVTGGALDAKTRAGTIRHSGGLSLTKGSTSAQLTAPAVVLGKTSTFSVIAGSLGRQTVANVDLSKATITPSLTATGGSITVTGAAVNLTATAAGVLGAQFGVQLPPNAPLGTVSATLQVS
jgi:hypothetical protein